MSKILTFKVFAIDACICAVTIFILYICPGFKNIDIKLQGCGWLVLGLFVFVIDIVQGLLSALFAAFFLKFGLNLSEAAANLIDDASGWVCYSLALFATSTFTKLASYENGWAIFAGSALIGLAYGLCRLVQAGGFSDNMNANDVQ